MQQVYVLSNQFFSFFKVICVEGGSIARLDIVTVSTTYRLNLIRDHSKNIKKNSQLKLNQ